MPTDPLREWDWIQASIERLRACPKASLLGLRVTCLVRLAYDLHIAPDLLLTPEVLQQTARIAQDMGLFDEAMSEKEWLRRIDSRRDFHQNRSDP